MNIQTYFDYHQWATERVCDMLTGIEEEVMEKEIPSSFPGLKRTLSHMAWAESLWLNRILGEKPKFPRQEWRKMPTDEILSNYSTYNQKLMQALKEMDLETKINYTNTAGNNYTNTIHEIGVHVVNHASYHRGQIVTLLRQINFTDILAFDFIAYLRT